MVQQPYERTSNKFICSNLGRRGGGEDMAEKQAVRNKTRFYNQRKCAIKTRKYIKRYSMQPSSQESTRSQNYPQATTTKIVPNIPQHYEIK